MRKVFDALRSHGVLILMLGLIAGLSYAAFGPTQSKIPIKVDSGPATANIHSGMPYWKLYPNPALGDTALIKASTATSSSATTTVTFTSSDYGTALTIPRSVVVRIEGTDANINAGTITLTGTNIFDETITQDYSVTENTPATIAGTKAFKTVTSALINQQDGANVGVSFGTGDLLGLPVTSSVNGVLRAWEGTTVEATAPTVTVNATDVELNTVDFNTAYNGTKDFTIYVVASPFKVTTSDTR